MVKKETDASQLSSERYEVLKEEYGDTETRVEVKFGKVTRLNVVTVYPILKKENNEAVRNDASEGMLALLSEHKKNLKGGRLIVAIYIRQSVAKIDSISDETQLQACKDRLKEYKNNMSADDKYYDDEHVVYKYLGFTGANTNRPNFQKMLKDIESGKISMVVAYKLDRLNRSMSDYVKIMDLFKKYDVLLITAKDAFGNSNDSKFIWNLMMRIYQLYF